MLEEALRRRGMAYVVFGGIRFYSRKEIKDVLAYLRLLVNPSDDESFRRIVNVPARGIGAVTVQQFEDRANQRGISMLEVLRETAENEQGGRARKGAEDLIAVIDELWMRSPKVPATLRARRSSCTA